MMAKKYSNDKNIHILISALKAYKIKNVIASPGTTNFPFVYSLQNDDYFNVYSCVDERSAAYMACGMAGETGEPVVITCTGATASRNYLPGLTEAFYRKLPIIVIAGTDGDHYIGHLTSQIMDRSVSPKDAIKYNVSIQNIKNSDDEWSNRMKVSSAFSEIYRRGGGPVLITLQYSGEPFESEMVIPYTIVKRIYSDTSTWPSLQDKKIAIFIGSHRKFSTQEIESIDQFCESNNAYVLCDHTSSYNGNYRINYVLAASQKFYNKVALNPEVLIHVGEISGEYYVQRNLKPHTVWRVNPDGEIRDKFRKLQYVFEMSEETFFKHYTIGGKKDTTVFDSLKNECNIIENKLPEIPFSNIWVAQQLHDVMPKDSTVHFGILNSLRSWNFFNLDSSITTSCNVGGFGIDGSVSSLIGSSLCRKEKLYFVILGDLAFFYDLNSICNRHVSNNIRIMVVNNGHGTEFSNYDHPASMLGEEVDRFVAAGGHNGCKSNLLLKHYAEDIGFRYISASNKEEFENVHKEFIDPVIGKHPILFEIFTNPEDESDALKSLHLTEVDEKLEIMSKMRSVLSDIKQTVKKII